MKVVVLGAFPGSLINFRGRLIEDMVAAGHEVIGCAAGDAPHVAQALAERGAVYVSVPLARTGLNPLRDLSSLVALTRVLRRLGPDVLLAYTAKPVIYGSFAARLTGVPKVFTMIEGLGYAFTAVRGGVKRRVLRTITRALYRRALSGSAATFVLNPDDRDDLRRLAMVGPDHPLQIINGTGIDLDHYASTPVPAGPPVFLLIARLLRDKGVAEFVEAARTLRAKHASARFRLLGGFDQHPTALTKGQVDAWVRAGLIEYLGKTPDVRPYLRESTVYVLPSYREGMPRTILEAMATGRPIITTDVPGCRETVLPGENGFLVPPGDAAALAAAMERFIVDPDLAETMGRRSRQIAEQRFDVHKVNAVMLEAMGLR
jgi:glycosyltransferase involved in cell wall biosynthesis